MLIVECVLQLLGIYLCVSKLTQRSSLHVCMPVCLLLGHAGYRRG